MTVIAGLVADTRVVLAADGVGTDQGGGLFANPDKLRSIPIAGDETVLVGTSGRTALGSLFAYRLKVDGAPDPDDARGADEWAHAVAEAITQLAKDAGLTDSDGDMDGTALLAWRHHLWEIQDNLALRIPRFAAVGAGADIALGALDVAVGLTPALDPEGCVKRAVTAACRWNASCRPPVTVLATSP